MHRYVSEEIMPGSPMNGVLITHDKIAHQDAGNLQLMLSGDYTSDRSDLCRVNFEVNNLKPFPHLAFPHFATPENTSKQLGFDGELMASFFRRWRDAFPDYWCNGDVSPTIA